MRILLLVYGDLGASRSGPEIRGLALARALSRNHEVTVAIGDGSGDAGPGLRVVPSTRRHVVGEARRHDVFIAPVIPPYVLALKSHRPLITISDQYDPVELEMGTLSGRAAQAEIRAARAARALQLRYADVVLCANEAQRSLLAEGIQAVGRPDGPRLAVVPFGLPPAPERSSRRPLRERFPQIASSDRIVLWWGSIWRWLDAETAIRALIGLEDVRLVITAGPPRRQAQNLTDAEPARRLARSLCELDRRVLFLDEWIPYAERHHYLQEADAGLTLHRATPEAPLAARARYMDYLWCGLPCVLARGDEWAEGFADAGFATLVPPGDPAAVRAALLGLLDDPAALERSREAAARLARTLSWEAVVRPLEEAMAAVHAARPLPTAASLGLLGAVGAEYVRRGRDALVA
jgi:glycosyltransferase involved in cell wall biosynthesis